MFVKMRSDETAMLKEVPPPDRRGMGVDAMKSPIP
jgi:hypothetical protein